MLKVVTSIKDTMDMSLDIEAQVQKGDGAFHELWQQFSSIDVYENVQNVIVKLSVKESRSENWILINSHFDTVPMSPGAGDDGTMVGIMLEMLRVLAKEATLTHTVVFLFNGCEENSLQGAHSFIKHYELIDNIKYVSFYFDYLTLFPNLYCISVFKINVKRNRCIERGTNDLSDYCEFFFHTATDR